MSLWNKILVGVIAFASVILFYMAARTLQTHRYWRDAARKFQDAIEQKQKDNDRLVNSVGQPGEIGAMGIRQLRVELSKLLLDRRRAWFKCEPRVKLNPQNGTADITLLVSQPDPNGIADNTIVYAFAEADVQQKGRYLGEFKVTKSDQKQKQVVLTPTSPLNADLARLAAAKGTWTLYEVMPRDNHEIFALLDDQQKKALLPPESQSEYLKDGKPASNDDPAQRVADGKFVRSIRDYQVLLNAAGVRRTLLLVRIDHATRDLKLMEDALALAKQQEEATKQDVAAAKEEVKKFSAERSAVATYRKTLEQELAAAKAGIDDLLKSNQKMAQQIAKLQWEAARRIDQRTRSMARSGAGGT
jgi:hypothetical protein